MVIISKFQVIYLKYGIVNKTDKVIFIIYLDLFPGQLTIEISAFRVNYPVVATSNFLLQYARETKK